MNIPEALTYWTLDEVSECMPVPDTTSRELWGRLVNDPRSFEDYGSQMEYNEGSPNRLTRHWAELTTKTQADIIEAARSLEEN